MAAFFFAAFRGCGRPASMMSIPGPIVFGSFAVVHAGIALLALQRFDAAPWVALSLFSVEAVTAYDNFIVASGRRIGIGARAQVLNRMRFFLHAVCIGLLVPVYVGIGGFAGMTALQSSLASGLAFAVAALIALFGYTVQFRGLGHIVPVNYYGCLRYAQSVDNSRRWPGYDYTDAELAQKALPPFASIITVLIGLVLSGWVGWSAGVWLPFVVTALMFSASAFPVRTWGPLATSALEIIYSGGLLYTFWSLTG